MTEDPTAFAPTAAHRAVDRCAALLLEAQRLRRQLEAADVLGHDRYAEPLDRMAAELRALAQALRSDAAAV